MLSGEYNGEDNYEKNDKKDNFVGGGKRFFALGQQLVMILILSTRADILNMR